MAKILDGDAATLAFSSLRLILSGFHLQNFIRTTNLAIIQSEALDPAMTASLVTPDISRFLQPDPMAEKYYDISPYAYCAGDPVNYVDMDGKNIAVLLLSGVIGHLAMLIQNEYGVWEYYSVNGVKSYESTNGTLGAPTNDVGVGAWSSPQIFLDQAHKTTEQERIENPDVLNNYDYDKAFEIETTPEQDRAAAKSFEEIAKEDYHFLTNNCAIAVQRSLKDAGITPSIVDVPYTPTNTGAVFIKPIKAPNVVRPANAFNLIKSYFPNGTTYNKQQTHK